MSNPALVVATLSIGTMDNAEVAAANNALSGFGRVAKQNMAYEKMLDLSLIDKDGYALNKEILLDALSFVINRRIATGTFI